MFEPVLRVTRVIVAAPCDWCSAPARHVIESEHTGRAGQSCYRHAATALRWVGFSVEQEVKRENG